MLQFAVAVLGECYQSAPAHIRRPQLAHRRVVSVRRGASTHGRFLHSASDPWQGQSTAETHMHTRTGCTCIEI